MNKQSSTVALLICGLTLSVSALAVPVTYNDKAVFLAAAGSSTTYGFETHGLSESTELASPLSASQLDNNFDLAYTNLNSFQIIDNAAAAGVVNGSRYLFTHSSAGAPEYTLTFSNFGGVNAGIIAFGLTITDFASNITDPVTITYDAGGITGTLLSVVGGQPDFTQNFIGLTVDGAEAFNSITLSFDDVLSGFQDFDEVIYAQAAVIPTPATLALFTLGLVGLLARRGTNAVATA